MHMHAQSEGERSAELGDWGSALSCWNRALALLPEDGGLHELRAQALNETDEAWEAVQAASRAVGLLPESANALMTLAHAQLTLGEVCTNLLTLLYRNCTVLQSSWLCYSMMID